MAGKYLMEIRLIEGAHRTFPFDHIDPFVAYSRYACRLSSSMLKGLDKEIGVTQGVCYTQTAVMTNLFGHLSFIL
jgi:hypothetical protein